MSTKSDLMRLALEIDAAAKVAAHGGLTLTHNRVNVDFHFDDVTKDIRGESWRCEISAHIDGQQVWSGVGHVMEGRGEELDLVPLGPSPWPNAFIKVIKKNLSLRTWQILFGSR